MSNAPVTAASVPSPVVTQPVAFVGRAPQLPGLPPSSGSSIPSTNVSLPNKPAKADTKPVQPEVKRKVEGVLAAAAIAAIIVQASRAQYHSGGRPCACPDDSMRNGRACGGRNAYSRPGGASPLCYPSDVTAAMIESYRQRQASR
jgi:hypothetical protein